MKNKWFLQYLKNQTQWININKKIKNEPIINLINFEYILFNINDKKLFIKKNHYWVQSIKLIYSNKTININIDYSLEDGSFMKGLITDDLNNITNFKIAHVKYNDDKIFISKLNQFQEKEKLYLQEIGWHF